MGWMECLCVRFLGCMDDGGVDCEELGVLVWELRVSTMSEDLQILAGALLAQLADVKERYRTSGRQCR